MLDGCWSVSPTTTEGNVLQKKAVELWPSAGTASPDECRRIKDIQIFDT